MTSNAILITPEVARMLKRCGMNTISVSIDGLPETHDRIRGLKGAYKRAMEGIQNLIDLHCFDNIMVTTVVNHETIGSLSALLLRIKSIMVRCPREKIFRYLEK